MFSWSTLPFPIQGGICLPCVSSICFVVVYPWGYFLSQVYWCRTVTHPVKGGGVFFCQILYIVLWHLSMCQMFWISRCFVEALCHLLSRGEYVCQVFHPYVLFVVYTGGYFLSQVYWCRSVTHPVQGRGVFFCQMFLYSTMTPSVEGGWVFYCQMF